MNKRFGILGSSLLIAVCLAVVVSQWSQLPQSSPVQPSGQTSDPKSRDDERSSSQTAPTFARTHTSNESRPFTSGLETASSSSKSGRIAFDGSGAPTTIFRNGKQYPVRTYKPLLAPNDPFANQWWLSSTGLNTAWDYTPGDYQTTVAVIDTGFALGHEEFAGRWAVNTGEQGAATTEAASDLNCSDQGKVLDMACNNIDDDMDGIVDDETGPAVQENPSKRNCSDQEITLDKSCNNIDDDGNGLADDVTGWDFINFDSSVQAGETNPDGPGTTHGTMVSGILAATGNNGKGIAGVNWSTKILPLQALDDDEYGNTLSVARAIVYAADRQADIISISLGAAETDQYLREAIEYALDAGALVVAASGNDGCNCITYPANYPEVLAVGASDRFGARSSFSSYGSNLDLVAPGESMASPTWTTANQTTAYQTGIAGTSFSTPYTSGLLALAKSRLPNATWGELTAALTEASDRTGLSVISPRSDSVGFGVARADRLLQRVTSPDNVRIRYQFGPIPSDDTLGSPSIHECTDGRLPSTPIYELKLGAELRLTASELSRQRAGESGWSSKRIFYACSGLPNDIVSMPRTINLFHEIYNRYDKK